MRSSPRTTPTRARLGGTAAVLAGLCYGAEGYFDIPAISGYTGALLSVLSVALPALFLGGCWAFTPDYRTLQTLHKRTSRAQRDSWGSCSAASEPCWV
jgi:hypothetical protein